LGLVFEVGETLLSFCCQFLVLVLTFGLFAASTPHRSAREREAMRIAIYSIALTALSITTVGYAATVVLWMQMVN
jgi:hypothetical protein